MAEDREIVEANMVKDKDNNMIFYLCNSSGEVYSMDEFREKILNNETLKMLLEEREEEIKKIHMNATGWSYSKLSCFEHCKYAFYLNYIVNDNDLYLSEGNYYAEVGSFVHEILAMIFEGKLGVDDAAQYFADHYNEAVCYQAKQSTMDKTYEACANYFATANFDWLKDYEILGVELETKLTIEGYDFIGYIDLLLRHKKTGEIWIIDHKSMDYPFKLDGGIYAKCKNNFEMYRKQMYLYCHAVKEIFGEFPTQISWNHFKDGKIATISFNIDEYEEAMEWFMNTIHEIEKEHDFKETRDYFYCSTLCNFRNSCEYNNFS